MNDIWKIYRASAELCVKASQHADAEKLWLSALEVAEDYGPDHAMLTTSLEGLAEVFWYQGKHESAAPICRRLLRMYEQKLGHHHPDVGTMAYNLALLYHSWGKYVEAEPFCPSGGAYTTTDPDTIPEVGVLYATCPNIGLLTDHQPDTYSDW